MPSITSSVTEIINKRVDTEDLWGRILSVRSWVKVDGLIQMTVYFDLMTVQFVRQFTYWRTVHLTPQSQSSLQGTFYV